MTSTEVYWEWVYPDVLLNFYVHQTECKMEENTVSMHMKLYIILLLQGIGGKGGGGSQ